METEVLRLGDEFRTETLIDKAHQVGKSIADEDALSSENRTALLVLNAGLDNFLEGKHVVAEPSNLTVEAWVKFSGGIAAKYVELAELYPVFVHAVRTVSVLESSSHTSDVFRKRVPVDMRDKVNWTVVDAYLRQSGHYKEMFIDKEVYYTNVSLPQSDIC